MTARKLDCCVTKQLTPSAQRACHADEAPAPYRLLIGLAWAFALEMALSLAIAGVILAARRFL